MKRKIDESPDDSGEKILKFDSIKSLIGENLESFSELNGNLPTNCDIIRHYNYLVPAGQFKNKVNETCNKLVNELISLWNKHNIPIINRIHVFRIVKNLNTLYKSWKKRKFSNDLITEIIGFLSPLYDLCD